MAKILTKELRPGMITAEDIYGFNRQLILPKDLVLTDKTIEKLEFYSVLSIEIVADSLPNAMPESIPSPELENGKKLTYSERVKASPDFQVFKKKFEDSLVSVKGSLNDIVQKNAPIDSADLLKQTSNILDGTSTSYHVFDMLQNMRSYDDPTYAHCVNVSLISNVFGRWLGFPEESLQTLTLAGMLHDIGKLKIPEGIVTKPGKLTDEEYAIIKKHTVEGFAILKDSGLNPHVINAALMHHERCDGKGYPLGINGDKIDYFAKIIAIADVYDAMTAARCYRGPLCPFKVISIFEQEGLQKYDSRYILVFLENIVNTYMHNRVRLSNGMEGEIVLINKGDLSHPLVDCDGKFVDLSKEHGTEIEEIL